MIFLTLGTYPLAFDRLLIAIDDLCGAGTVSEEIYGQIGHTDYSPKNFGYVKIMEKREYDEVFNAADQIISHAGIGSISMALERNKPMLVMPRLAEFKEVVNDHQVQTAHKFEALGHIVAAYNVDELQEKIASLKSFVPAPRRDQADRVAERVRRFLEDVRA